LFELLVFFLHLLRESMPLQLLYCGLVKKKSHTINILKKKADAILRGQRELSTGYKVMTGVEVVDWKNVSSLLLLAPMTPE